MNELHSEEGTPMRRDDRATAFAEEFSAVQVPDKRRQIAVVAPAPKTARVDLAARRL
jgi:hypothetical protein